MTGSLPRRRPGAILVLTVAGVVAAQSMAGPAAAGPMLSAPSLPDRSVAAQPMLSAPSPAARSVTAQPMLTAAVAASQVAAEPSASVRPAVAEPSGAAPVGVRAVGVRAVAAEPMAAGAVVAALKGAAPRNTIPGAGTYLVGKDFNAGVYRSVGNSSCYWARASDAGGSIGSVIANDIGSGQRLVYVKPTDKVFRTSGCKTWTRVTSAVINSKSKRTAIPGNGVYFVGSDFVPGTYRSTGNADFCYWERSRSADGASSSIIANDISKGQLVVTIGPGGVFQTSRCATWTRIG
ncbi:hypothetical protein [Actinoplanes sp. URMC 104]|uniref:hypothetical protein n=1 Tax=Actinoplanes sp. URMC 104 TaxID=3423409 RepID=UPI003F1A4210